MLKKENRLKKKKDFDRTFKLSRPVFAGNLSIRAAKQKVAGENKVGFIISNKVDKRSTRRNALRRQLRAIFQELLEKTERGYDLVVIVKKDFDFPYVQSDIKKQMEAGLKRAGVFKNPKL